MLNTKHMKNLGFRSGLRGTAYLLTVVNYILDQPEHPRLKLVEDVYTPVAEEFGVTKAAIDKGIRYTIAHCDSSESRGKPADVIWELVERCRDGEFTA